MFFFIPTGSNAERSRRPLVTIAIAVLCVAVYVGTTFIAPEEENVFTDAQLVEWVREHPWLEPDYDGPRPEPAEVRADTEAFRARFGDALDRTGGLARRLSLVPTRGFAQVGWVTSLFVHFGFFHLFGNLLFLWIVGPLLEEAWGRRRFAAFYLAAGLFAGVVQFALSRHEVSSIGGASGAIAGSMGAFAVRFATSRIRFLYLLWFIRPFAGSVWVPAWLCGVGWFGSELWDLSMGGAPGVATGAHVGGFVLGGVVAFAMRGLGFEKELLTVAESREEQSRLDQLFFEAQAAHTRGDFDVARQTLVDLQQQAPAYPGLTLLLAEVELRAGRGQARLERVLRDSMKQPGRELEGLVGRLEDFIDPRGFSTAFAWQLAERLAQARPPVAMGLVRPLVEAAAAGSGAASRHARAWLTAHPRDELELEDAQEGFASGGLELSSDDPAEPETERRRAGASRFADDRATGGAALHNGPAEFVEQTGAVSRLARAASAGGPSTESAAQSVVPPGSAQERDAVRPSSTRFAAQRDVVPPGLAQEGAVRAQSSRFTAQRDIVAPPSAEAAEQRAVVPSPSELGLTPGAVSSPVRVLEAGVVGVSAQGLELSAAGATRVVPFQAIGAVHAGLVPSAAGRALIVELVMRQPGRVVRLSGSDPCVPALFPGQAPPAAWQGFLAGLRRAAQLPAPATPWTEHPSLEAFVASRPQC